MIQRWRNDIKLRRYTTRNGQLRVEETSLADEMHNIKREKQIKDIRARVLEIRNKFLEKCTNVPARRR